MFPSRIVPVGKGLSLSVIYIYVYANEESINIHRLSDKTAKLDETGSWLCELQEVTECHNLSDVKAILIMQYDKVGDEMNSTDKDNTTGFHYYKPYHTMQILAT